MLFVLVAASWGFGRRVLRLLDAGLLRGPFRAGVPLVTGLGCTIVMLQALGIAGALTPGPLAVLAGAGGLLAALELRQLDLRTAWGGWRQAWAASGTPLRLLVAATLAFAASTVLSPLAPPREWDELIYHLPHASAWAATGRLTVNGWLRYPWFPYNYDLLYAAALVAGSDVLPHLMHALAGWCAALLLFAWARPHFGAARALLAVLLWLVLARPQFSNAYIDLGVALFVLLGVLAVGRWRAERRGAWLLVCAFALGLATGAKYQVLTLLPFFALALWRARPTPRLLAAGFAAFLLPCAWWYARNLVLAGDPVAPLGGRLFGFTDWSAVDYAVQMADIRRAAGLPPPVLWAAVPAVAAVLLRADAGPRVAAGFAGWALLAWAATSRYPRYLLPAYPVLAAFAVRGWEMAIQASTRAARVTLKPAVWRGAAAVLLAVALAASAYNLRRAWPTIAATPQQRDAFLSAKVAGYPLWQYLRAHPYGRIYQLGLEDAIYYAPRPIFGDVFGRWRYADYMGLDAPALHRRLAQEGFDAIVVDTSRVPGVVSGPGFARYFALERQHGPVQLYSLRKGSL